MEGNAINNLKFDEFDTALEYLKTEKFECDKDKDMEVSKDKERKSRLKSAEGEEGAFYMTSCGPHRRGYLAITHGKSQLVICTESEMKSDITRRVSLGQFVLQLEDQLQVLPDEIQKIAEVELRETPEVKEQALKTLKQLLEKERDENALLSPLDSDVILLAYLRTSHFYPESAFKRMTNYYRFKQKYSTYCSNLIPQNEKRPFEKNLLTVLPKRDKHGRRILVVRAGKMWDPSETSVKDLVRGIMMIVKAAILEPVTQTAGAIVIIDVKDLGYSQMKHLISLSLAEMIVTWVQDCFPCRLKTIHVVNINALFGLVLNVFKKFLNEKFQKRVIVHNKPETLDIDKDVLPTDLGGSLQLPDNQGLLLHKLLCLYGDQYEAVTKFGYPKEEKKEKKGWF
ncbi:retinaldehyde-binding protein 1-like [Lycorma delicatula]|uniref:retinaldehyde-binding protein 1-like n=1 Tax=Lycorma delicatula TaxID=130591 RepID=UPI003F518139